MSEMRESFPLPQEDAAVVYPDTTELVEASTEQFRIGREVLPGDHFPTYAEATGDGEFGGKVHTISVAERARKPFDHHRIATVSPSSAKHVQDARRQENKIDTPFYLKDLAARVREARLDHVHSNVDRAEVERELRGRSEADQDEVNRILRKWEKK